MKICFSLIGWGLSLIAGLTALGGCSTTVNSVERQRPTAQRNLIYDKRVITDSSLDRKVCVVGVNSSVTPGGLMRFQVEITSLSSSIQPFNYRIEWFDESGMLLDSPSSGWIHGEILGRETRSLVATAPKPGAKDFRVKFVGDIR
jgi:uncharacterized protein YcfL